MGRRAKTLERLYQELQYAEENFAGSKMCVGCTSVACRLCPYNGLKFSEEYAEYVQEQIKTGLRLDRSKIGEERLRIESILGVIEED